MNAAWPRDSCPERLIKARPLTASTFRQVSTARCWTNSPENHGIVASASTTRASTISFLLGLVAGARVCIVLACMSGFPLSKNAARTEDEHHDHENENQHVGRAGAQEQAAVTLHQTQRHAGHCRAGNTAQPAQNYNDEGLEQGSTANKRRYGKEWGHERTGYGCQPHTQTKPQGVINA